MKTTSPQSLRLNSEEKLIEGIKNIGMKMQTDNKTDSKKKQTFNNNPMIAKLEKFQELMDSTKISDFDKQIQMKVLLAAQVIDPKIGLEDAIGWTRSSAVQMLASLPVKTLTVQLLHKNINKTRNGSTKVRLFLKVWCDDQSTKTFNATDWDIPQEAYDDLNKWDWLNVTGRMKLNTWDGKNEDGQEERKAQVNFELEHLQSIETPSSHQRRGKSKWVTRSENRYEGNPSSSQYRTEAEQLGLSDEGEPAAPLGVVTINRH